MKAVYYGPSPHLPIRLILTAKFNAAHRNHLHVEGIPKKRGTPPRRNPGMPASTREIYDAVRAVFPNVRIGIYNRRYIGGTTTWSQHSWSNALDIYADGVEEQQPIYDFLTTGKLPEGGGEDVKEVYARLQASLVRAGYDLGNFRPYLPAGDPDSLPGCDGSWGPKSRAAQDAANKAASSSGVDSVARNQAAKAHNRLNKLRSI